MIFIFQGSGGSDEIVKAATARKVCSRSPAAVLVTTTSSSFSSQQQSVRLEDSPVTWIQILLGGTAKASCPSARGGNQCPPLHQEEGRLGIMSARHFAVVIITKSPSGLHCIMDLNSVSPIVAFR